jgi:hypothetical protein
MFSAEFIRTYIQIQEELKINIQALKMNIETEKKEMEKYKKLIFDHQKEILNQYGCCVGSKLNFEIAGIKTSGRINNISQNAGIFVKMTLNENSANTTVKNINNLNFGESFNL